MSNEHYLHNPLIHADRRLGRSRSRWVQQFDCSNIAPLIICRGPIRKEAMDVFAEMGIGYYGILLSEKDSIVYRNALAPELRSMADPDRIHRVPDYTGSNKEEREQRIGQIIQIARDNGYNAVFAGYGFMAEDEAMVAAMEAAGLNFIGPCSRTVHDAGLKDEAKRTALREGVSVTPGVDNATALTLLKRYPDAPALQALATEQGLDMPADVFAADMPVEDLADRVLAASYSRGVDLYSVEELCETVTEVVAGMAEKYPDNRVRLKAISGGGGKGQRILGIGETGRTAELVREILNEVKTTGVGDNKNVLVELNIETTRHQ
ncbi:MAG: biotin carboxylase N-terminal domain-containing protein, partial [Chromatocurvus sp.]